MLSEGYSVPPPPAPRPGGSGSPVVGLGQDSCPPPPPPLMGRTLLGLGGWANHQTAGAAKVGAQESPVLVVCNSGQVEREFGDVYSP